MAGRWALGRICGWSSNWPGKFFETESIKLPSFLWGRNLVRGKASIAPLVLDINWIEVEDIFFIFEAKSQLVILSFHDAQDSSSCYNDGC